MESSSDKKQSSYTTKIGPNDVLLGRGDHSVKNEGNVRFRLLVKAQKSRYKNVTDVSEKHDIACEIIRAVRDRGGQFLRRVEPLGEAEELGVQSEEEAWVPADESIVIKKCKQAFRDKVPKKESSGAGNSEVSPLRKMQQGLPRATPFSQLPQQLRQPALQGLAAGGSQLDEGDVIRALLANVPRPPQQHMDINSQLAHLLGSSSASTLQHHHQQQQQQQEQLSTFLNAEAAMAAELQRRQGVEQTLALLRRNQQQNAQDRLGQHLLQQLARSQQQQRQAASSSSLAGGSQGSVAQLLRQQQVPTQNDWLARTLAAASGGNSAAAGPFSPNNAASANDQLRLLQEMVARRDEGLAAQEAQRQQGLAGLQSLQQLQQLQLQLQQQQQQQQQRRQQQQVPIDSSATRPQGPLSDLELLRALVAGQQRQHQHQQRRRPVQQQESRNESETAVVLGSMSPPVPFVPFARKRSNSEPDSKRRVDSPLSEQDGDCSDDSIKHKRFKTEQKSDSSSSSLSRDSSSRSELQA